MGIRAYQHTRTSTVLFASVRLNCYTHGMSVAERERAKLFLAGVGSNRYPFVDGI